jgi:DUF971 family protein
MTAAPHGGAEHRDVPSRLALDLKAQRLVVEWHDGHRSEFSSAMLRFLCPCAACRGHAPGEVEPPSWEQVKDVRVLHAGQVGGYALQFSFSDGHDTGLYAYDRLRDACPCDACKVERRGPPPVDLGRST